MRIAIFSDQFYPELSGVVDSITAFAKELAKRGHYVHFYVPRYSALDYQKIDVHEKDSGFGEKIGITRFSSFPLASPSGQGRIVIPAPWDWRRLRPSWWGQARGRELHADCIAAAWLTETHRYERAMQALPSLFQTSPGDNVHPPGAARMRQMNECHQSALKIMHDRGL